MTEPTNTNATDNTANTVNESDAVEATLQDVLTTASPQMHNSTSPANLLSLLTEAARACLLRVPQWDRVPLSPLIILILVAGYLLTTIGFQWLAMSGPVVFNFRAFGAGWFPFAAWAWLCFCLLSHRQKDQAKKSGTAPSAGHLFVLSMAQGLLLTAIFYLPFGLALRTGLLKYGSHGLIISWLIYLTPVFVMMVIQSIFLLRVSERRAPFALLIVLVMLGGPAIEIFTRPPGFWFEPRVESSEEDAAVKSPEISQEVFEEQARLLDKKLAEIQPQRPGIIDLYSLSFAPYGEEKVFLNETSMVTQVMASRFDAEGRSLQLVNNPGTIHSLPWATPLNLQRAIQQVAKRMDVNEDILFLHMSSHGANDGELSAGMWPLSVKTVTPEDLKKWLDEAGIKYRVISISACYAGNWVAPLSDANSLIMTASDADHTSYGCGSKSDLTFFGRAMYDEQLRNKTLSFEAAHAAARPIIKQREDEAGKSDGYSNPQIAVGEEIRGRLKLLEQRLQAKK